MTATTALRSAVSLSEAVLVFGGPYSNFEATRAVLDEAGRRGIPASNVICTGDLVAYCGSPAETVDLVRRSGIHVVMGNCDEQLANGADDCGCGFPEGSACERLSADWYAFADRRIDPEARRWLASLPRRIDLELGGVRLAVIHGSVSTINQFVFASSPEDDKRQELALSGVDGVIGGHCGVPFTQAIDGKLWHNPGVIGMPANDGTPRVWFSVLTPVAGGINIEHVALEYDHAAAQSAMRAAGLPGDYREALGSGLWPSCDVLPPRERELQGQPVDAGAVVWSQPGAMKPRDRDARCALLFPQFSSHASNGIVRTAMTSDTSCCPPVAKSSTPASVPASCCAPSNAEATRDLYREAALAPDSTLCCAGNPVWQLPELRIPPKMIEMNYGCGSTVHPADLARSPSVLYVGVGAGLEVLQFAYFSRRRGAVIGLDVVDEMLTACRNNLAEAEEMNPWFKESFVDLRRGDAVALPIADASIDVAAQNCLFNIFHADDLKRALGEMNRVLKPGGRLILSDPICEAEIPAALRGDERLRAMCLTGAIRRSLPRTYQSCWKASRSAP